MNLMSLMLNLLTLLIINGNIECNSIPHNEETNLMRRKRSQTAEHQIGNKRSRYFMDIKKKIFLAQVLRKIDTSQELPELSVTEKPAVVHKKKGKKSGKKSKRKHRKNQKRRKRKRRKRKGKKRKGKKRKERNRRRKHRRRRKPRNVRSILSSIDYFRKHDREKKILKQIKDALKITEPDVTWEDLREGYLM